MLNIRRLDTNDRELLSAAYDWDLDAPLWYRQADAVFGEQEKEDFLALLTDSTVALIGIFTPELIGVIVMKLITREHLEAHLLARRGADSLAIVLAGCQIRDDMFAQGAKEVFVWVASRNRHVRRICEQIGFRATGLEMLKGSYRNKVIVWQYLSVTPWANEARNAA